MRKILGKIINKLLLNVNLSAKITCQNKLLILFWHQVIMSEGNLQLISYQCVENAVLKALSVEYKPTK